MSWPKAIFALVVILLYIPLVFMGANVFFPEYSGQDSYYNSYDKCSYPRAIDLEINFNETCYDEQILEQNQFEQDQNKYNANKYVFIVILSLITLLIALLISLENSIITGLFLGSVITTFISTWIYFETQSKIGFTILVIIFFTSIYLISKKNNIFKIKN